MALCGVEQTEGKLQATIVSVVCAVSQQLFVTRRSTYHFCGQSRGRISVVMASVNSCTCMGEDVMNVSGG